MTSDAAGRIADAAGRWLDALDGGQRARATFAFDDAERFAWDYRPGTRGGLSLADMTPGQRDAAQAILDAALSERGATEVRAIVSLEAAL